MVCQAFLHRGCVMFRTKWHACWSWLLDQIDCHPRTVAYLLFLVILNFVWDVLGHWPL